MVKVWHGYTDPDLISAYKLTDEPSRGDASRAMVRFRDEWARVYVSVDGVPFIDHGGAVWFLDAWTVNNIIVMDDRASRLALAG